MKKIQKGITLIEVIVGMAVFTIISLTLFSSVIGIKNVVNRQEEYVKLKMVCYDINAYYLKSSVDTPWYNTYFSADITLTNDEGKGYLTSEFIPTLDVNDASYVIEFSENEEVLIISIYSIDKETTFIEKVKFPID